MNTWPVTAFRRFLPLALPPSRVSPSFFHGQTFSRCTCPRATGPSLTLRKEGVHTVLCSRLPVSPRRQLLVCSLLPCSLNLSGGQALPSHAEVLGSSPMCSTRVGAAANLPTCVCADSSLSRAGETGSPSRSWQDSPRGCDTPLSERSMRDSSIRLSVCVWRASSYSSVHLFCSNQCC